MSKHNNNLLNHTTGVDLELEDSFGPLPPGDSAWMRRRLSTSLNSKHKEILYRQAVGTGQVLDRIQDIRTCAGCGSDVHKNSCVHCTSCNTNVAHGCCAKIIDGKPYCTPCYNKENNHTFAMNAMGVAGNGCKILLSFFFFGGDKK